MKFATTLTLVAGVALVDARRPASGSWAEKKLRQTKDHLERAHGRGLTGLIDPMTGEIHGKHFKKGFKSNRLGKSQITIDGIDGTFDLDSFVSSFLGFVNGITYKGVQEDDALTNCFYAGYTLVESGDQMAYILENAGEDLGSYKWFQGIIQEPIHFLINTTVFYQ
jgi:hypothetical protein